MTRKNLEIRVVTLRLNSSLTERVELYFPSTFDEAQTLEIPSVWPALPVRVITVASEYTRLLINERVNERVGYTTHFSSIVWVD